jgi:hypothetical protein
MTPGTARDLAVQTQPNPVIHPTSKRIDLTFDYDEMHPNVASAVIARSDLGKERYGQHLHSWNHRDAVVDLIQELVDALIYAQQDLIEAEHVYKHVNLSATYALEYKEEGARDVALATYRKNTIMKLLEGLLA